MPSQSYLFRTVHKPRSRKGSGSSAPFLFGLSRGFYVPPKESFHRAANFNHVSKKSAARESAPEAAKRHSGLSAALVRLFGRSFGGV